MRRSIICILSLLSFSLFGQNVEKVQIETTTNEIKTGDIFKIIITLRNSQDTNIDNFPNIDGFRKEGKSVSHTNVSIEAKNILQHVITQNYVAEQWGTFELPTHTFIVDGIDYTLEKMEIIIHNSENPESEAFSDSTNEDALLFLFVNKQNIVVGESFRIYIAFYVSEDNTASWEFPNDLSNQVNRLASQLKPENSLESRSNIIEIQEQESRIKDKNYIRYKLYESVYYPLNAQEILLPSVSLKMDRIIIQEDSSFTEVREFKSRAFRINVSDLPDHPLKNRVSVGDFKLSEPNNVNTAVTGKILNYALKIRGQGNANTLLFDKPQNDENFDFYPPQAKVTQAIGGEIGEKTFTFKVFPKDSGIFDMGNYFNWIYFNTSTKSYDTLKTNRQLFVTGSKIETYSANTGDLYDGIEALSTDQKSINYRNLVKNSGNVLLFLMLAGMLFIFEFNRRTPQ